MVQTALKFSTMPFFSDNLQVEPRQVLEPVSISLHLHSPLLQNKEFRFPLISGTVWKIFLQESCPEVSPSYPLFAGLHQLLHPPHEYLASATRRNVTKVNFCTSVHPIARHIFSHSLNHASSSFGTALRVNLPGLFLMKSSIITGRVGATLSLGYVALSCIASTIR